MLDFIDESCAEDADARRHLVTTDNVKYAFLKETIDLLFARSSIGIVNSGEDVS